MIIINNIVTNIKHFCTRKCSPARDSMYVYTHTHTLNIISNKCNISAIKLLQQVFRTALAIPQVLSTSSSEAFSSSRLSSQPLQPGETSQHPRPSIPGKIYMLCLSHQLSSTETSLPKMQAECSVHTSYTVTFNMKV